MIESILDCCPDAVLAVDDRGVIRLANATAEVLFGWPRAHLVGGRLSDLIPVASRAAHGDLFATYLAAPSARPMREGRAVAGLHRSGRRLSLQVSLAPVHFPPDRFAPGHFAHNIHVAAWIRRIQAPRPGGTP